MIKNTGASTAFGVAYSISPALPSGTRITPGTCGTISPGGACELTVTPGSNDGTSALVVSGTNTNTLNSDIDVLTYGSTYQSGYVFAVDDTTPDTESIGGKITALEDQALAGAPDNPNGIRWSSDAQGNDDGGVAIYAINTTSTPSNPSPDVKQNDLQLNCNGATDGSCNTTNILAYYDTELNVPPTYYASGLCLADIDGYSDWFLPSICQLGYGRYVAECGSQLAPAVQQNIETTLIDNGHISDVHLQEGYYWSSTQEGNPNFKPPKTHANYKSFLTTDPFNGAGDKNNLLGVRCIRDLDY